MDIYTEYTQATYTRSIHTGHNYTEHTHRATYCTRRATYTHETYVQRTYT